FWRMASIKAPLDTQRQLVTLLFGDAVANLEWHCSRQHIFQCAFRFFWHTHTFRFSHLSGCGVHGAVAVFLCVFFKTSWGDRNRRICAATPSRICAATPSRICAATLGLAPFYTRGCTLIPVLRVEKPVNAREV